MWFGCIVLRVCTETIIIREALGLSLENKTICNKLVFYAKSLSHEKHLMSITMHWYFKLKKQRYLFKKQCYHLNTFTFLTVYHPYSCSGRHYIQPKLIIRTIIHYSDDIMGAMPSQTPASRVFTQSSASLAFVWGILPVTGEFPAQKASNAENVSIWWRHHGFYHNRQPDSVFGGQINNMTCDAAQNWNVIKWQDNYFHIWNEHVCSVYSCHHISDLFDLNIIYECIYNVCFAS